MQFQEGGECRERSYSFMGMRTSGRPWLLEIGVERLGEPGHSSNGLKTFGSAGEVEAGARRATVTSQRLG